MPSAELLYIQNERVDAGTLENTVSINTVSTSIVSTFIGDAENESSSLQAERKTASNGNKASMFLILFIIIGL